MMMMMMMMMMMTTTTTMMMMMMILCWLLMQVLFTQFEFTDDACLPPDVLRQAMSISFSAESRFQLGEMDDAAECFVSKRQLLLLTLILKLLVE